MEISAKTDIFSDFSWISKTDFSGEIKKSGIFPDMVRYRWTLSRSLEVRGMSANAQSIRYRSVTILLLR